MRREDDGRFAPRWRAILEVRWRIRLQEVTELSMAYHGAASGGSENGDARRLLRRFQRGQFLPRTGGERSRCLTPRRSLRGPMRPPVATSGCVPR